MDVVARVQGILLKPKEEWPKIKEESLSISQIITSYVMIVAAIPAIAQFIGLGIVGQRVPFVGWFRLGIGTAFARSILSYVLSVASAYILSIIINALAPTFSSKQNPESAMKLAAYAMTPAWVASVLGVIPMLYFLVMIASLYGVYILYLGLDANLMETPKEKMVSYLVVIIVIAFVIMFIIGAILGALFTVGAGLRFF
ncbi:MAG: YIP1 family protein [Candidatus Aminicenantes bacterium]|nr:YIP1 family protein [Candidatus Aminicenantes bacterium]